MPPKKRRPDPKGRVRRAAVAEETMVICERGFCTNPTGWKEVSISEALQYAKCEMEVTGETTFLAIQRLHATGRTIGCLNFASAKNPGGGFLRGSLAQEEALSREGGLVPCLETQMKHFYEPNRSARTALYLNTMIVSPGVPFFRDDNDQLLETPIPCSVITCPAPNGGEYRKKEPRNEHLIRKALEVRAEMILRAAALHSVNSLILGAWGCGVFQNSPELVAQIFKGLLRTKYRGRFERVVFAVYDTSPQKDTYRAFHAVVMGDAA